MQRPGQPDLRRADAVLGRDLDQPGPTVADVIRATEVHRYQAVIVENVVDVVRVFARVRGRAPGRWRWRCPRNSRNTA